MYQTIGFLGGGGVLWGVLCFAKFCNIIQTQQFQSQKKSLIFFYLIYSHQLRYRLK